MLLLSGGYANHLKGHYNNQKKANYGKLPHCPANNISVICNKVYRSSFGLKRHMVVQWRVASHVDPINTIEDSLSMPDTYQIKCWS